MENWSHCQMLPSTVSMKDSSSLQAGLNTRLPQRALKTAFIKGCCSFQSQPLTDSCLFLPANYKCCFTRFPRESPVKDDNAPDAFAKAKMMVAKVPRKVLRKRYMSMMKWSLRFQHCSPGSSSANIGDFNWVQVWFAEVPRNASPHDVFLHFIKTSC